MEIQKALSYNSRSEAKFASLYTYEGNTTVKILESPYYVSGRGYDNTIALKDVEYNILEGVLYIKGTKHYHYKLHSILGDLLSVWGKRSIWKINDDINNRLVTPFEKEDFVIRKLWIFRKKVKGFDLEKATLQGFKEWHPSKEEYPYEAALSNFTLKER